jgi:hypothetical protein
MQVCIPARWPIALSVNQSQGLPSAAMAGLKLEQILALLLPIVLIQLGLMLVALVDLEREERRVRGGNKIVWALVIVFLNVIGPILYLTVGREDT